MNFEQIRSLAILAMFSDDVLYERLVLKGGNALNLVHKAGARVSLDLDFSIEQDFDDLEDVSARIFSALKSRFESAGYVIFDKRFRSVPPDRMSERGGYIAEFKLIEQEEFQELGASVSRFQWKFPRKLSRHFQTDAFRAQNEHPFRHLRSATRMWRIHLGGGGTGPQRSGFHIKGSSCCSGVSKLGR